MAYSTFTLRIKGTTLDGALPKSAPVLIYPLATETGPQLKRIKDTSGDVLMEGHVKYTPTAGELAAGVIDIDLPDPRDTTLSPTGFGYEVRVKWNYFTGNPIVFGPAELDLYETGGILALEDVAPVDPAAFAATAFGEVLQAAADAADSAASAAASAASVAREQANGVAGLTSAGKLYEARIPDRLSDVSLSAATVTVADARDALNTKRLELLRDFVRKGGITVANPAVPTGDSHTDSATSAHFIWDRLTTIKNKVGEGLEGVASAAIVPMGKNGQALSFYRANPAQTGGFNEAMALAPSVTVSCWLTNDVRNGALGLTVDAIRVNGAALLNAHVADIKAHANRPQFIVLRVPAPYTTVNTGSDNYISDGAGNINPAGLAQIYTDGVRAAYYEVQKTHPDVLIYDPQTRLFGVVSPTANNAASYFANQIHQTQKGYEVEGDDFAAWIGAAQPYKEGRSFEARRTTPVTPWTAYSRDVEDPAKYVLVGEYVLSGTAGTVQTLTTFADLTPKDGGSPVPGQFAAYDLVQFVAADSTYQLPSNVNPTTSGGNVRLLSVSLGSIQAMAGTKVRHYRQAISSDATLNAALADSSLRAKFVGRVVSGNTTSLVVKSYSVGKDRATQPASEWAAVMASGNNLYVEGVGLVGALTTNYAAAAPNLSITGLSGTDYSALVGRMVVITGTQAVGSAGPTGAQGPAAYGAPLVTGLYSNPAITANSSTAALTINTHYAIPFVPLNDGQIDKLSIDVTTLGTGALVRLALYASDANKKPAALLKDYGTVDASTTGFKETTGGSATAVTAGTLYWLVAFCQGSNACNVRTLAGQVTPFMTMAAVSTAAAGGYEGTHTNNAAAQDPFGGVATAAQQIPWVRARAV